MSSRIVRRAGRVGVPRAAVALVALPLLLAGCASANTENAAATASGSVGTTTSSAAGTTTSAATTSGGTTPAATPSATTATCAFGGATTLPADTSLSRLTVAGVRVGQQDCYDRLVIDLSGDSARKPGYNVRYVPQVLQDGTGKPIVLRGGAFLSVTVGAADYDASGQPTFIPADPKEVGDVTGFSAFRQVAMAGSFEGMTTIGLGVREQLPVKVSLLDDGGGKMRLVVDVAHAVS